MKKQILTGISLLCIHFTWAQQEQSIAELIVTENRTEIVSGNSNRMIQVISSQDIKNSSAQTLTELLENTAGIDVRSRGAFGTQADIQIRGGSFEQTLILINGVKFTDPQTGHHVLNLPISLVDIERIEILKGAAARVYGQNAYAGVVNIITKKVKENAISANLMQGQNNLSGQLISIEWKTNNFGQRISLSRLGSDGYQTNTDFNQEQVFYQGNLENKFALIDINAGYLNKKMGANGFYTNSFPWQYEEIETGFGTVTFQKANWLNLKSHVNLRQLHDLFQLKRDTPSFSQNIHLSNTYSFDASIGDKNKWGNWNAGAEYRIEKINSSNLGKRERKISSVFAEQQLLFWKKIIVVPGICFNNYSDYGFAAYPAIDLGYHWNNFKLGAQAGKTFRVPTFTELYYTDGAKSSLGNPNLKPEQAFTYELNLRYKKSFYSIEAAWFRRDGKQQIDWIKDSASAKSWEAINSGAIITNGYEINTQIFLNKFWSKSLVQTITLGYCNVNLSKPAGEEISRYVYDYLKQQFTSSVQLVLYKSLVSNIRIRYEERVGYTSYWLVDLKLAWQKPNYQFFVEGSNLTNQTYYEVGKVLMPGTWLRAGASLKLGI
ncbi:MAG: TonB-dependent receptor [Bacteroidia bacterium]|nr:TonB-dependent receptor [Bacteroidia bacterium]MCF8426816.1 TonB-dependent receptor [Bacteroidia bacterium]MCF8446901.1 TonB-dependent receptor [Bacteroidia bacterium]